LVTPVTKTGVPGPNRCEYICPLTPSLQFKLKPNLCNLIPIMADDSREENVYMAKLAEQAERYDEVCLLV
jgi:hypothetical protein